MNGFGRSLLADLRERQILPAVVLLLVLAIAIPVGASIALSKSAAPAAVSIPPLGVGTPHGVLPPAQEIEQVNAPPYQHRVLFRGSELNPFREATPSTKSVNTSSSASATSSASSGGSGAASSSSSTPKSSTSSKSSGSHTTVAAKSQPTTGPKSLGFNETYTADLDTTYGGQQTVATNVERDEAMPPSNAPEIVYLGVLKGGKEAAFLFTNPVQVARRTLGSATCLPNPGDCQIVELAPGKGMSLKPTVQGEGVSTFTFRLISIGAKKYSSVAAATAARRATSSVGAALVASSSATALTTLAFDTATGALIKQSGTSGATGASGSTG
jgi:hypothetical protein